MMFNRILMLVGILLVLVSVIPILFDIIHIGVWMPLTGGVCLFLYGMFRSRMRQYLRFGVKLDAIILIIIGLLIVFFVVTSVILMTGFQRYQNQNTTQTVVVLGCKVKEDQPTKMLAYRLNKAYDILRKYPNMKCVVTGGQGEDERYPESQVMKQYLVDKGIDEDRILEENQSKSTQENLKFTKQIIEQHQLSKEIVIVTDFFHQYRANYYAHKEGFISQGASCYTNPYLVYSYWFREILAVAKAWVFD